MSGVPPIAVTIALVLVGIGLAGAAFRLVRGPEPADRVVALDLITVLLIAITSLIALRTENVLYLDPALALALVGFLATVALARYLELRTPRDAGDDEARGGAAGGDAGTSAASPLETSPEAPATDPAPSGVRTAGPVDGRGGAPS